MLLFSLYFFLPTVSFASSVDEVVDSIQKKYSKIQNIRGEFSQTSHLKDLERVERYQGEFFIKKPSSMRWIFSDPRDEEVIIREGSLWIYKKSQKQALKSTFSKEAYAQVPIALLNSLGDLQTDYEVALIEEDTLALNPKNKTGLIEKIHVEVNKHDFPVKSFSIFDSYGNVIEVAVTKVKINTELENSLFIFKPGPDVEVFDLNQ
jgi:chaperone LolA